MDVGNDTVFINDVSKDSGDDTTANMNDFAEYEELCPDNRTRFSILGREKARLVDQEKTFLVVRLKTKDGPGDLFRLLKPFAYYDVNLTFLCSRYKNGCCFLIELDSFRRSKIKKLVLPEDVKKTALKMLDEEDFEKKI